MKKIKKSNHDRILFGVIGGIADYFKIDPTILRLAVIFILFFNFPAVVVTYILAALVIPKDGDSESSGSSFFLWLILILLLIPVLIIVGILLYSRTDSLPFIAEVQEIAQVRDKEVLEYLENQLIDPIYDYNGKIFADYYIFERNEDQFFIWAYVVEYFVEDNYMEKGAGISSPMIIFIENGRIVSHWIPEDGSKYSDSLAKNFPAYLQQRVLSFNQTNTFQEMISSVEERVEEKIK